MGNTKYSLDKAFYNKNDEFYTQYSDIEFEMNRYFEYFEGKCVLCNCNDAESEFYNYFHLNFSKLKLKELVCVHYNKDSGRRMFGGASYYKRYCGGIDEDLEDCEIINIPGNGDFRSKSCINLLESCDIVITNPPFSIISDLFDLFFKYKKDFIIIGFFTKISYKPLLDKIINNEVFIDVNNNGRVPTESFRMYFLYEHNYNYSTRWKYSDGEKNFIGLLSFWFTTLKRERDVKYFNNENISYTEENYPKYDNYDAIHVEGGLFKIPKDYSGKIGLSFGEIYKIPESNYKIVDVLNQPVLNGKNMFKRIIICKDK